jgi:hypothetical protein
VATGATETVTITNSAVGKTAGVYTGTVVFACSHADMGELDPVELTVTIVMTVVDSLPPTITAIRSTTADGGYGSGVSIDVTVDFSEAVTLSGGTLDVELDTGQTVSIAAFGPAASASGTYVVGGNDSSPDLDAVGVSLRGATLVDGDGTSVWVRLPSSTIADTSAIRIGVPTVTLASTAPDPTWLTSIPVTATFSKDVVGFTSGDLVLSNATVTGFGGSGSNYSFNLVPAGRGTVAVQVPGGAAEDAAGNENTADELSRFYSYRLTVETAPAGRGTVDGTNLWTNSVVTLTPQPGGGYSFRCWTGTGVPIGHYNDEPLTLTMDRERTIKAVFGLAQAATTRTWTGDGNWFDLSNWSPADFPYAGDDVVLAGGTCTLPQPQAIGSLTVQNTATLVFTNWNSILSMGGVAQVESGGTITSSGWISNGEMSNNVYIVCRLFIVDSGGTVDVSEKGYRGGYTYYDNTIPGYVMDDAQGHGTGGGAPGPASYGGSPGGGYGGEGGSSHNYPNSHAPTYGSSNAPVHLGSGGGSNIGGYGGHGGGAVRVEASSGVRIYGSIEADGGQNSGGANRGGGGSGGSIYLSGRVVSGDGTVSARGGHTTGEGGGGGGGRIAVWRLRDTFSGTVTADGGTAGWGASYYGEDGTIVWGQLPSGTTFIVR